MSISDELALKLDSFVHEVLEGTETSVQAAVKEVLRCPDLSGIGRDDFEDLFTRSVIYLNGKHSMCCIMEMLGGTPITAMEALGRPGPNIIWGIDLYNGDPIADARDVERRMFKSRSYARMHGKTQVIGCAVGENGISVCSKTMNLD